MNEKKRIIIGVLLIIGILTASYMFENIMKKQGLSSAKIIKITENSNVVAYIDGEILKKLAENSKSEESIYTGITLLSTLNAAGQSEFKQLKVVGQDNKPITLNRNDVNDGLVLFISNDGTVNLSKGDNNLSFIVEKITEIKVIN